MATKKTAALKKDEPVARTTAVAVRKTGGAVADMAQIRKDLQAQASAMGERTAPPSGNKIVAGNDKMFKLPDGSKVAELRAVIVDFGTVHSFYERPFDAKNVMPPGCFAYGSNPKDMAPVAESPNRQAENCQECPMNEFGSAGDGKACKNARRMVLLPLNDAGDDVDGDGQLLVLDTSPTAIKGFDGYVQSVTRAFQLPPIGVITTIGFDGSVDYQRMVFSDPVPLPSLAAAYARQGEAQEMLAAKPDFSGWKPVEVKGRGAPAAKSARR
jgi:hypothetical protein